MSRNKARINYLPANYMPLRGCLNNSPRLLKYIRKKKHYRRTGNWNYGCFLVRDAYENKCLGVAERKQQKTRENYETHS